MDVAGGVVGSDVWGQRLCTPGHQTPPHIATATNSWSVIRQCTFSTLMPSQQPDPPATLWCSTLCAPLPLPLPPLLHRMRPCSLLPTHL